MGMRTRKGSILYGMSLLLTLFVYGLCKLYSSLEAWKLYVRVNRNVFWRG